MSKHTPGPWTANYRDGRAALMYGHCVHSAIYSKPGITDGRDAIVEVRGATDTEARANTRLISAAPDLLAALKAMSEYMAYAEALGEDKAVFKNARAAIAKAEGTS